MSKILLCYYTGTFNTRYLTKLVKERFEALGHEVTSYEIDPLNTERLDLSKYDIIGLGYPIYGFNVAQPFAHFIKKQRFHPNNKVFIYKNSGETFHANDASSIPLVRKVRRGKTKVTNEYHFIMPYNIHFRFDEKLVKEMLVMDNKLLDITVHEVLNDIPNIKKYKLIHKLITFFVKIQYLGGPINSFFYKVNKDKCINCNVCIKNCPTKNIYRNAKDMIKFHHNCLMCMRCSLNCPKDAIDIGLLQGWKVNGAYNLAKINEMELGEPIITEKTKGFFRCYIETYKYINDRHKELFGE